MEEATQSGIIKKFLYINRRAPHGTIYAHEALETVLIGAAFEQDVTLVFLDDGVFQLKKNQHNHGRQVCHHFSISLLLYKFCHP